MPSAGFEPAIPFLEHTIQTTRTEVYYVINIYTYKYKYIYIKIPLNLNSSILLLQAFKIIRKMWINKKIMELLKHKPEAGKAMLITQNFAGHVPYIPHVPYVPHVPHVPC